MPATRLPGWRPGLLLATATLVVACLAPAVFADGQASVLAAASGTPSSRISSADPLNGGFLLVNNHGMLFRPQISDIQEDVAYARWLGSGTIRVFATDNNGLNQWDGTQVGSRIADVAPILRAENVRLIVALVNNHRAVPGELSASTGWLDNYFQLLQPFYASNWRGAYLQFARDLVSTVESRGARDVIFAWELGNELHTPWEPDALVSFVVQAVEELRALDPLTPILPGTMGANHIEPGNPYSSVARWLYCDAPIDAYTLHAYDWASRERPGDMPIDWDLYNVTSQPCPDGRTLPIIVEELGTSRGLPGVYDAADERGRLQQELRQIAFVRHFPQVVGFGVWNGESPRLVDRTFVDVRRGLTSYGTNAQGGGSCYDPTPDPAPGVRCQLEQVLRGLSFVRVVASSQWTPGPDADPESHNPVVGLVDPVYSGDFGTSLSISGWVLDPTPTPLDEIGTSGGSAQVDDVQVFLGEPGNGGLQLARAQLGLPRTDVPSALENPASANAGFSISIPLGDVPVGATTLTLVAHTPEHGNWLSSLEIVVPSLGTVPAARTLVAPVAAGPRPVPRIHAEIQAPQPGDLVTRSFTVQVLAPGADRVDMFLEPGRDHGGRLVGSASAVQAREAGTVFQATVTAPSGKTTLYVHARWVASGQEQVLTLPVIVS